MKLTAAALPLWIRLSNMGNEMGRVLLAPLGLFIAVLLAFPAQEKNRKEEFILRSQLRRRGIGLLLVAFGCTIADAAFAINYNPIDDFALNSAPLSLSTHAEVQCTNGAINDPGAIDSTTLTSVTGESQANCSSAVTHVDNVNLAHADANGNAGANLANGTLKGVAIGRALSDQNVALTAGTDVSSFLYDTLTVNGNWSGTRTVELRLTVDGKLTSNAANPNWQIGNQAVSSRLMTLDDAGNTLGNAGLLITQGNNGIPFLSSLPVASGGATIATNAVNSVFDPNDVQFTMSYFFPATTANRSFTFVARLSIGAAMGFGTGLSLAEGTVDFGNTAQFALFAPSDVTVTSASGQFLTAAVPAPPANLLFLSAMAVMSFAARPKRC